MRLWVRKGFADGTYSLEIGLETTALERDLIARHGLEPIEVWASPTALGFDTEAEAALEKAAVVTLGGWRKANANTALSMRGLWLARKAGREARLCVGDLLAGCLLQAEEVYELMATEQGVRAGFDGLAAKLRSLDQYEMGDEDVTDPVTPDLGTPARDWVKMVR